MSGDYDLPQCYDCTRLDKADGQAYMTCGAFPKGIPEAVLHGRVDHKNPFKGDNGLRFEPLEGAADGAKGKGIQRA